MYGGAIKLAEEFLNSNNKFDLIIASDMLDLNLFLSLTRKRSYGIPVLTYFHENQLTYPWSSKDKEIKSKRDRHYAFINYTSALSSDVVIFNSEYHKKSFIEALHPFLKSLPDYKTIDRISEIEDKSKVIYVGIDCAEILGIKTEPKENHKTALLWNHRWEEDKNPEEFLEYLRSLNQNDFELILLGERSSNCITLSTIRKEFQDQIMFDGYCESRSEYIKWLRCG